MEGKRIIPLCKLLKADKDYEYDETISEELLGVHKKRRYYTSFSPTLRAIKGESSLSPSLDDDNNDTVNRNRVVLIVDDIYFNRMVISEMIKKFHITTKEANNGAEAINIVEKSFYKSSKCDIKLVLMDLNMPVMNGVQSTIRIRELEQIHRKKIKIPIVGVTAHDSINDRNGCSNAGMQDYVVKPITNEMIENILKTYAPELLKCL